jgi:hypothetical protein
MKPKYFIALVLVLIGTNLFSFATTRYWTTKHVLTQAQDRMDAALKKEGLYEQVYPSDRPQRVAIVLAIRQAGGMYYWWNDGLIYWGAAVLLTLSGLVVTRYEPRKSQAAS